MKNLILILILISSSMFALKAQNDAIYDFSLKKDVVMHQFRAKAVDTVSSNKTTFTYTIYNANQAFNGESFTNYWELALDSISGTPASIQIDYQRRKNIFTTWVTDSTQYFAGSTSDTTLVYYDTSAKPDPYRRIKVTYGSGFKIKIDWLSGLFLLE